MTDQPFDPAAWAERMRAAAAVRAQDKAAREALKAAAEKRLGLAEPGGVDGAVIDAATGVVKHLVFGHAGEVGAGEVLIVGNTTPPGQEVGPTVITIQDRLAMIEAALD